MRPVRAVNRFINEMKGNYEKRGDKVGERKIRLRDNGTKA
jgi:hypothetical protein